MTRSTARAAASRRNGARSRGIGMRAPRAMRSLHSRRAPSVLPGDESVVEFTSFAGERCTAGALRLRQADAAGRAHLPHPARARVLPRPNEPET